MERSSLEETLLDNLFRSLVVMISHPIATLNPINSIASLKFLALADIANFTVRRRSHCNSSFLSRSQRIHEPLHAWTCLELFELSFATLVYDLLFWSTLVFPYVCELWLTNLVHSPSRTDDP